MMTNHNIKVDPSLLLFLKVNIWWILIETNAETFNLKSGMPVLEQLRVLRYIKATPTTLSTMLKSKTKRRI